MSDDGSIDMIPFPQCGSGSISVSDKDAENVEYIGDDNSTLRKKIALGDTIYELHIDGTVKKEDVVIATDVVDMTVLRQTESYGYVSGNFPNADNPRNWNDVVKAKTRHLLETNGAPSSWVAEFENFIDNVAQHPACMWAGAGTGIANRFSLSPCIHTYDTVNGKKYVTSLVIMKSDGKLYDENGEEQVLADRGANGFKSFYEISGTRDKIITIDAPDTNKRFADISPRYYNDMVGLMY